MPEKENWIGTLQYKIWSLCYENNNEDLYKQVIDKVNELEKKSSELLKFMSDNSIDSSFKENCFLLNGETKTLEQILEMFEKRKK